MNENDLKKLVNERVLFKFDDKPRLGIHVGVLEKILGDGYARIRLLYPIDTYAAGTETLFKLNEIQELPVF